MPSLHDDRRPLVTSTGVASQDEHRRDSSGSSPDRGDGRISRSASRTSDTEAQCCGRNWICFWVMGCINNTPYCVVLTGAHKVADQWNMGSWMPLLSWALVAFGVFVSTLNTIAFAGKEYWWRFGSVAAGTSIGLCMVGAAGWIGDSGAAHFAFALAGVCVLGAACTLGESCVMGYLHKFPPGMVGGWSSGTGSSGIIGTLMFLGLNNTPGISISAIFFMSNIFVIAYVIAFLSVKEPTHSEAGQVCEAEHYKVNRSQTNDGEVDDGGALSNTEDAEDQKITCARIRRINKIIFSLCMHMFIIYVGEYTCQLSASYVQRCTYQGEKVDESSNFLVKNFYSICQFCYQFGVLLSRSSLAFVQIERMYILTILQTVNAAVWLTFSKTRWLSDPPYLYILPPYMVFVGLLGGAVYVNVFNLIQKKGELPTKDTEMAMNIGAVYVNFGIVGGSVTTLLFVKTVLRGMACDD